MIHYLISDIFQWEFIKNISDVCVIAGLIFSIYVYKNWENDHKKQKANEYALKILKKIKKLHLEIELLRSPKFFNKNEIIKKVDEFYIPLIDKKINSKIINIQAELLIADKLLIKNKNLQSKFDQTVVKDIFNTIGIDIYLYQSEKNKVGFDFEKTELYKIIFPANNIKPSEKNTKNSALGVGTIVINDEFNKKIETMFKAIYDDLESNLICR